MTFPLASLVSTVPVTWYLALGLVMFCLGGVGVVVRRNPVVVFMCIELMLNAVNLTFLTFAAYGVYPGLNAQTAYQAAITGQMMVIFVMAVAAAEVAVGLGIIMAIFRLRNDVDVDDMSTLRN
ncbi:MAG: NADH-quinone oxidoreductase subunit NuoK [Fimbriimonadaceae bacterium]|nr:NADH-quinone oxidoreductase subunit NuoK [Fimbriimonadaceae bacterium]